MYNFIKCPTCNTSIGEFYDLYQIMKNHKYTLENKDKKISYKQASIDTELNINTIDIFEILGIKRYCCRGKIISCIEFNSLLYSNKY